MNGGFQQILGTNLVSALNLGDVLAQREKETQMLVQNELLKGKLGAEKENTKARQQRGIFETVGTIIGAAGGAFIGQGNPMAIEMGAKAGQTLGGALSGKTKTEENASDDINALLGKYTQYKQYEQHNKNLTSNKGLKTHLKHEN